MTVKRRLPSPRSHADRVSEQRGTDLRARFADVDPAEVHDRVRRNAATLIDVREGDEMREGSAAGALRLGRGFLELRIEVEVTDKARPIHLLCDGGARGLYAADSLERLGYENVSTVAGGFERWREQGLPVVMPRTLLPEERERFAGQLRMREVGETGQLRLLESSVLVVGVGGRGAAASLELAAAGVGRLGLADDGEVTRADLRSGIVHTEARVGVSRVGSALRTLQGFCGGLHAVEHALPRDADDARRIVRDYDVVVDCSADAAIHEMLSTVCVELGVPHVWGSASRLGGQVAVLWPAARKRRGSCWGCAGLEPAHGDALGAVDGVIGSLQAVETIKLVVGAGSPPVDRVLRYDAERASFDTTELEADADCPVCR